MTRAVVSSIELAIEVTTVCNVSFETSHGAVIGSVVYALLPCPGNTPRAVHRRVMQQIGAYAHTISTYPLTAAAGSIASRIEELPGSRAEALQTLQYLRHQRSSAIALYQDHRIPLTLVKIGQYIDDNGLADFDEISVIQARDAEQQTDYLDTLRAYLVTNHPLPDRTAGEGLRS